MVKEIGRGGLDFVDKGKAVEEQPMVFIKALSLKETRESLKPIIAKPVKKIGHLHKVIFHYCRASSHIRPRCFKILRELRWKNPVQMLVPISHGIATRKVQKPTWIKKEVKCLVVSHRSVKSTIDGIWFFNNGYSRNMTSNQIYLTDL